VEARSTARADRTIRAVELQVAAMGSDIFEIGLFKPDAPIGEVVMLPRVWDRHALMRSVPWLRHQNLGGRNIYIRPKGEHSLSLVDDLSADSIARMIQTGFAPAVVVETSSGNFQAWLKHPERLSKEIGTAASRDLAEQFGGDTKAADWRHFGRLAGFTNRKAKYRSVESGLYPFVKVIDANGGIYAEADSFLSRVRAAVEQRQRAEERVRNAASGCITAKANGAMKPIEAFRADPRYGGDGSRIDLAYAIHAFSRGASQDQVEAAIGSRDLSHKGTERRQKDYIARTIRKALDTAERGCAR